MESKKVIFLVALIAGCAALPPPKPDFSPFFTYSEPSRIVGGTPAADGSHPHMAALATGTIVVAYLCGASIVGSRHLITAAHCIPRDTSSLSVYVGSNQLSGGNTIYRIQRAINHPQYDSWFVKNDISILETSAAIAFTSNVQPIGISYDFIGGGVLSRAAGWGRTAVDQGSPSTLLEVDLDTIDGDQCVRDALAAQVELNIIAPPVSPDVEICTFRAPGFGTCHGDSGSALVKVDSNEQIGVVSWGFPCAVGAPDVFARVSAYTDWIQANIN